MKDPTKCLDNKYFDAVINHYDLDTLSSENVPPGVVPSMKEMYLNDEDFMNTFKMTKSQF